MLGYRYSASEHAAYARLLQQRADYCLFALPLAMLLPLIFSLMFVIVPVSLALYSGLCCHLASRSDAHASYLRDSWHDGSGVV